MKSRGHSPKSMQWPFTNLSTPLESPRRAAGLWSLTNFCFSPASGYNFAVFAGHAWKNTLFGGVTVGTPQGRCSGRLPIWAHLWKALVALRVYGHWRVFVFHLLLGAILIFWDDMPGKHAFFTWHTTLVCMSYKRSTRLSWRGGRKNSEVAATRHKLSKDFLSTPPSWRTNDVAYNTWRVLVFFPFAIPLFAVKSRNVGNFGSFGIHIGTSH